MLSVDLIGGTVGARQGDALRKRTSAIAPTVDLRNDEVRLVSNPNFVE